MNRFLKKRGMAISQPRRVAAMNLARQVCEEMHMTLGKRDWIYHSVKVKSVV